ncbi:helix-turn-helix domain-containing protein [Streptomyces sp. CA-111067]|uniref:helix-turn-helix domain-containing protein n=1 Tax=Streptomyces sp. CA-111067 TaxID=3240046 RepID=UPI003D95FCEF
MTVAEWAAAPGSGVVGMPTWDMVAVRKRRLAPMEQLDGADGAIWALLLDGDARLETAAGVERLHAGDAFHVDARTAYRLVALTRAEVTVGTLRAVPPLPSPLVARDFAHSNRGIVELVRICPLDPTREQPLFAASYAGLIQAAMVQAVEDAAGWPSGRGDGLRFEAEQEPDGRPGPEARFGAAPGSAGQPGSDGRFDVAPDPQLTALVSVLDAHPGRPWTVESMARVAHLSRSSLGERFRRELGRSPAQVLREVRMRHARELLASTDRAVEQIGFSVGYGSAAAFSRAFSAHHGSSPQAWRSAPGAGVQGREADASGECGDGSDE